MAAALSWEAAQTRPSGLPVEVEAALPGAQLVFAVPEHKVPLPGGRRESQCDVFALLRDDAGLIALAVEAKVAEPFGPTVGEWLAKPTPGRLERLAAICALLGCDHPPGTLRYQLFHRTAAAVIEARRLHAGRAAMLVQSFSTEHRWFDDFAAFGAFLNLPATRGVTAARDLPGGLALQIGWVSGSPAFI